MTPDQPTAGNLTGSLLVAHPSLRDPNFHRTILFLSHHNAIDGAVGLILNRPADQQISDFGVEQPDSRLASVPVFFGGPVGNQELLLAVLRWLPPEQNVEFRSISDPDELAKISPDQIADLRAFVGYAGWDRGQLEAEIAQKAWLVLKPTADLINPANSTPAWRQLMQSLGPLYTLLAEMPDDPSLN